MSEHAETESSHGDEAHGHDDNHDKHYIHIWKVLCVLLVISVLGPELEIQVITLITAFGIAIVKAYLVCKHFMHVDLEKPVIHYLMIVSLMLLVLFFSAISPDVMNHEGTNWVNEAARTEVADRIREHSTETSATVIEYNNQVLNDPSALWGETVELPFEEVRNEPVEGEDAHH